MRIVADLTATLGREPTILINLSGRGDKDMETAGTWFGVLDGAS
jgi:tryptophan synthase beta chain